jgi:acetyl-CoA synthetase
MTMDRRLIRHPASWADMRAAFRWDIPPFFNMAEACCDSWARTDPDKIALIHIDNLGDAQNWTYGALKSASDRFANALRAMGIGQGDRVAILLPQGPAVLITHFAAHKLGAIVLPLFTLFGEDALAYRLADSGAKLCVTDAANLDKLQSLRPNLPDLTEVLCIDPAPVANLWQVIEQARADIVPVRTLADDPAVMIYTSGTTGPAKGVLHAHRFLLGHLPNVELSHGFIPKPRDCGWTPADWAWIGGLMDMAMPCLYYGVPLVSHRMRKFDPDAAYALIATHAVRNMFLPPTALKLMRQAAVPPAVDIRSISSGGESLGAEILDWGQNTLGAPINEIYGQTECNLVVCTSRGVAEAPIGAMGQAVPGHDVVVLDVDGQEMPRGQIGEISVRRGDPVMFLRYWNKPDETAAKFTGDWMRTGDLGSMDENGFLTFSSRDDDVITSAGYRIGPSEIENCLTGHPDVVMAAAIGVPDPVRTEVVKAFVVLREGANWQGLEADLIALVRQKISPHVAPRTIVAVDALPMTATGKIMRRELRGL